MNLIEQLKQYFVLAFLLFVTLPAVTAEILDGSTPEKAADGLQKLDVAVEQGEEPLPPVRNAKAVDCFLPISADNHSLTLQYGWLQQPDSPIVFRLLDAGGNEIATQNSDTRFGRIAFSSLQPDRAYVIQIRRGEQETKRFSVRTLPLPGGEKQCRIAVLSDPHISLAADTPYGRLHASSVKIFRENLQELNRKQVSLLLLPGDLTDASKPEELQAIKEALKIFQGKIIAVPGNHDRLKGTFKEDWLQLFGPPAGLQLFRNLQILALDTADGRLGTPENLAAIAVLNPDLPAIIISHFQLQADPSQIADPHAAISDAEAQSPALKKLAACKAVLYVGHKNMPCLIRLGKVMQINAPQTTQFLDGYLIIDVYQSGLLQSFIPSNTAYWSERSRLCGGEGMKRARNAFEIWNRFLPWPD